MATAATQVGEFFRLGEFADRRGGGLPPGEAPIHLARLCCLILDPVRRQFGVTRINSGYRTPASNAAVGGASESRHLHQRFQTTPAVDFHCATGTPQQWYEFCDRILGNSGGLGVYRSHVHVDRRPTRARWRG